MRARGRGADAIPDYGNLALHQTRVLVRARLRHWHGVLASARKLQRLDPWQAAPHVDASAALFQLSRYEDAAVSLQAAAVLGGGPDVDARLAAVYHTLGDAAALLVRRHRCRALAALARTFADAALPAEAMRLAGLTRTACDDQARP